MNYRAEIDGLRAFAVVPVILYHAGFTLFSGGFAGVDVFFVISGYLITTILLDDIQNNRFSIVNFYERRARRLLPVLYTVVITTVFIALFVLLPGDLMALAKAAISIPVFLSNFFFWSERGYFGDPGELRPLIHTWSLAVEEQFYIVFPLVLLLLSKWGNKVLYLSFSLIFVLSLAASYYVTLLHFDTAFFFPFTRAWELIIGSFCALALQRKWTPVSNRISDIVSFIGLLLIFYSYVSFDKTTLFPYINALIPTIGTALFILFANTSQIAKLTLSYRPLIFIGLISYSLYLWHQPVFSFARHLNWFTGRETLFIFAAFCLSVVTYFLIEKPSRNRDLLSKKNLVISSVAGSILIMATGSSLVLLRGLPSRYSEADQDLLIQLSTYQRYTVESFEALHLSKYIVENSTKVILIGDSHAKDFHNVIVESGLFNDYEFSTSEINSECGNLLLSNYTEIEQFIPIISRERCRVLGRYEDEKLDQIIKNSNEIWLAGRWFDWVVEYLPESLKNLEKRFGKTVRVVGLKDFGDITVSGALSINANSRQTYTTPVKSDTSKVAERLDILMKDYPYYYPVMDDLCGGDQYQCRIFTKHGLLVSPDGDHLTREGAIEAAARIQDVLMQMREPIAE